MTTDLGPTSERPSPAPSAATVAGVIPQAAILANVNRQLSYHAMLRAFLAFDGWRVLRPRPDAPPTIMVTDESFTATAWLFSTDEAYQAAVAQHTAEAMGPSSRVERLDELVAALDPKIAVLRIDPSSPIALHIQTDRLDAFRRLARGARIERAMAEHRYAELRRHDAYYVPYFGVLGQGHNVIALPTERGQMVAAFTAEDAIEAFLATGTAENRAKVKFVAVDGDVLFGEAGPKLAQGVIVNIAGPRTFGFDLEVCRDIATA